MSLTFTRKPRLFFILILAFINAIGYGIVAPVYPRLVQTITHGGVSQAGYYYTLLFTVYSVMQFLFAPIIGRLSDRFGRRPLLLLPIAALFLQYVVAATAQSIIWLFVAEAIAGICGGSIVAVGAYVADITPPEKRGRSFGTIWGTAAVGKMIGPLIGGILSSRGYRFAFGAAAVLTVINFLNSLILVPESLPASSRRPLNPKNFNPFAFVGPWKTLQVSFGLVAGFLLSIVAVSAAAPVMILFLQARFGWSVKDVGTYMTFNAMAIVLGQVVFTRVLSPFIGDRRSVFLGLLLRSLGWTLIAFATSGWQMYALLAFSVIGSVVQPLMGAFLSRQVPSGTQGELQGVLTRAAVVAEAVGPICGGAIYRYSAGSGALINLPGSAFLFCAILGIATLFFIRSALTTQSEQERLMSVPAQTGS